MSLLLTVVSVFLFTGFPVDVNVLFWNVENLFDWIDSGKGISEKDFSSLGDKHWSKSRFWRKVSGISKTIMWSGECCKGQLPDIVAFAEVENYFSVSMVMNSSVLGKEAYGIVHRDSPDKRGIDVALAYKKERFELKNAVFVPIRGRNGLTKTRDILLVSLLPRGCNEYIHFVVNHHPSKFSGSKKSEDGRMFAMEKLVEICDSLSSSGHQNIVVMGDFNDVPDSPPSLFLSEYLVNKSLPLYDKGYGTIRHDGEWSLIDMFFVDKSLADNSEMTILSPDFLLVEDRAHAGKKPFRTYSGPRYIGGLSDHLPILLRVLSK